MTLRQKTIIYLIGTALLAIGLIIYLRLHLIQLREVSDPKSYSQLEEFNDLALLNYYSLEALYFDEKLTQCTRNFIFTADTTWERKYLENVGALYAMLDEAVKVESTFQTNNFKALFQINDELYIIENKAFELTKEGKTEEALALLEASSYQRQKENYLQALKSYQNKVDNEIKSVLQASEDIIQQQQSKQDLIANNFQLGVAAIIIVFVLTGLMSSSIFLNVVIKRLETLNSAAIAIATGQFKDPIHLPTQDEFESLAISLNTMGKDLQVLNQKIQQEALLEQQQIFSKALQDRIGILIAAIKLNMDKLKPDTDDFNRETSIKAYQKCQDLLDEAYLQIRELASFPINEIYDKTPLKTALEQLVNRMELIFSVDIKFITNLNGRCINHQTKLLVFNTIKALLLNAIQHARSSNITLQAVEHEDYISFVLEDDGIGFNPEYLSVAFGSGVQQAIEALEKLDSKVFIDSRALNGSTITFDIPLKK